MRKKVIIYSNNRIVQKFETAKNAAAWLGIRPRTFRMMMLKHSVHGKYICRYLNHKHYEPSKKYVGPPIKVFAFLKDGTFVNEYPSLQEAARILEVPNSTISMILKGKCISTGGYTFSLTEKFPGIREIGRRGLPKKPIVAAKDGIEKTFPSIYAASKILNINRIGIIHVLKGRYKTSSGYTFNYLTL